MRRGPQKHVQPKRTKIRAALDDMQPILRFSCFWKVVKTMHAAAAESEHLRPCAAFEVASADPATRPRVAFGFTQQPFFRERQKRRCRVSAFYRRAYEFAWSCSQCTSVFGLSPAVKPAEDLSADLSTISLFKCLPVYVLPIHR